MAEDPWQRDPQPRDPPLSPASLAPRCVLSLSLLWCDCLLVLMSLGERGRDGNRAPAKGLVVWGWSWGVAHLIVCGCF